MKKSKNSHMVSRLHPRNKPIFPPISPMMEKEELPLRILYKPTNTLTVTNITLCLNNKFSPNNELLSYAGCCFCISYPKDLNPTCKNTRLSLKSWDIKMLTKVMNTDSQENVATICPHFESESLASSLKPIF